MLFSCYMDYLFCGVVEVRGVQDRLGTACGRSAKTLCYDCGTSLCSEHIERCELCGQTFCQSCLSFHQNEHPKPASGDSLVREKRKSA
jgi:hypothetical protein